MPSKQPHFVVIVADSLRADTVERVPGALPYIDSRAIRFTQARSAGCWTLPATASLFTGLMPHEHGADTRSRSGLRPDTKTLAELLRDQGYATHMITANTATTGFGLDRGFDRVWKAWHGLDRRHPVFASLLPLAGRNRIRKRLFEGNYVLNELSKDLKSSMVWLQDTADSVFAEGLRTLETQRQRGEPSFVFMNLMEAHFPYHVADTIESTSWNPITALREYLALVNLVTQSWLPKGRMTIDRDMLLRLRSRQIKAWERLAPRLDRFVREVDKGDTIVVFLSDHGDCFGEDGMAYHFGNVTDAGNRVPLYWIHPRDRPTEIGTPISSRDLFRSILAEVDHPLGGRHIVDNPEDSRTVLQAHWYDHNGHTHGRYRHDQIAMEIGGHMWMRLRDGSWHVPGRRGGLEAWEYCSDRRFDPIEETIMDVRQRQYLRKTLDDFLAYSDRNT